MYDRRFVKMGNGVVVQEEEHLRGVRTISGYIHCFVLYG
jgi:hypothetical protein